MRPRAYGSAAPVIMEPETNDHEGWSCETHHEKVKVAGPRQKVCAAHCSHDVQLDELLPNLDRLVRRLHALDIVHQVVGNVRSYARRCHATHKVRLARPKQRVFGRCGQRTGRGLFQVVLHQVDAVVELDIVRNRQQQLAKLSRASPDALSSGQR